MRCMCQCPRRRWLAALGALVGLLTLLVRCVIAQGDGDVDINVVQKDLTNLLSAQRCTASRTTPAAFRHLAYLGVARNLNGDGSTLVVRTCVPDRLAPVVGDALTQLFAGGLTSLPADATAQPTLSAAQSHVTSCDASGAAAGAPAQLQDPPDTLPDNRTLTQMAAAPGGNASAFHSIVTGAAEALGSLRPAGSLLGLLDLAVTDGSLALADILPPLRRQLAMGESAGAAVLPLDAPALFMVYRQDVLQAMGWEAPRTWDDLVQLVETYGDSRPAWAPATALCATTGQSCDGLSLFSAIWHSLTQSRGLVQGVYFDPQTLRPLVQTAAFREAARLFARLWPRALPQPAGLCGFSHPGLRLGSCAISLGTFAQVKDVARLRASEAQSQQQQQQAAGRVLPSPYAAGTAAAVSLNSSVFRVAQLPGSTRVLDRDDWASLVACTAQLCPHGDSAAGAQATLEGGLDSGAQRRRQRRRRAQEGGGGDIVNRAPYIPSEVLVGGISSRSTTAERLLAWHTLSYLASPSMSLQLLLDPAAGLSPFRTSHFSAGAVSAWVDAGYDGGLVGQGLDQLLAAVLHPNLAWGLHMADGAFYRLALSDFLAALLDSSSAAAASSSSASSTTSASSAFSTSSPASSSTPAADRLALLTDQLYLTLTSHYNPSASTAARYTAFLNIGYNPERHQPQQPQQQQSGQGGAAAAGSGGTGRAVALGVALTVAGLAVLVVALFVAYRHGGCGPVRRRQRLSWCPDAPAVSPDTTLLITDIENSTRLWEELPEVVMGCALRLHHACLRRVMVRHQGYESATEGDSFILAFHKPAAALAFAVEAQQELLELDWPPELLRNEACAPVYTSAPAGFPFRRPAPTVLSRMSLRQHSHTSGGAPLAASPSAQQLYSAAAAAAGSAALARAAHSRASLAPSPTPSQSRLRSSPGPWLRMSIDLGQLNNHPSRDREEMRTLTGRGDAAAGRHAAVRPTPAPLAAAAAAAPASLEMAAPTSFSGSTTTSTRLITARLGLHGGGEAPGPQPPQQPGSGSGGGAVCAAGGPRDVQAVSSPARLSAAEGHWLGTSRGAMHAEQPPPQQQQRQQQPLTPRRPGGLSRELHEQRQQQQQQQQQQPHQQFAQQRMPYPQHYNPKPALHHPGGQQQQQQQQALTDEQSVPESSPINSSGAWAIIHGGATVVMLEDTVDTAAGVGNITADADADAGGGKHPCSETLSAEYVSAPSTVVVAAASTSRTPTGSGFAPRAFDGASGAARRRTGQRPSGGGGGVTPPQAQTPPLRGGSRSPLPQGGGPEGGAYLTGGATPWVVSTLEESLKAAMRGFDEGCPPDRKRRLLWRGLRIRMGLHSGVASESELAYNRASVRTTYSGECASVVRVVADSAQGGLVLLSGACLEALRSAPAAAAGGLHGAAAEALLVHIGRYRVATGPDAREQGPDGGDPLGAACGMSLFLATSPELAPRAAALPPPRKISPVGLSLYAAPVGRAAVACLAVPDAAALFEWDAAAARQALGLMRRLVLEQLAAHRGFLVSEDWEPAAGGGGAGAGLTAAFAFPLDAVRWALRCRELLASAELEWPPGLLAHELCREAELPRLYPGAAAAAGTAVSATAPSPSSRGGGGGPLQPSGSGPLPSPASGRGRTRTSLELAHALTASCDNAPLWAAAAAAPPPLVVAAAPRQGAPAAASVSAAAAAAAMAAVAAGEGGGLLEARTAFSAVVERSLRPSYTAPAGPREAVSTPADLEAVPAVAATAAVARQAQALGATAATAGGGFSSGGGGGGGSVLALRGGSPTARGAAAGGASRPGVYTPRNSGRRLHVVCSRGTIAESGAEVAAAPPPPALLLPPAVSHVSAAAAGGGAASSVDSGSGLGPGPIAGATPKASGFLSAKFAALSSRLRISAGGTQLDGGNGAAAAAAPAAPALPSARSSPAAAASGPQSPGPRGGGGGGSVAAAAVALSSARESGAEAGPSSACDGGRASASPRPPGHLTVKTTLTWAHSGELAANEEAEDGGDIFSLHLGGMDGCGPFGRPQGVSLSGGFALTQGGSSTGMAPPVASDRQEAVLLRGPRIRVGIDAGPVEWAISSAHRCLTYSGAPVSAAERLCAAAAGGQVLATFACMAELHRMQSSLALPPVADPDEAAAARDSGGGGGGGGFVNGAGGAAALRGPAVVGVPLPLPPPSGRAGLAASRHTRRQQVFSCRFTKDWEEALREHEWLVVQQQLASPFHSALSGFASGGGGGGPGWSSPLSGRPSPFSSPWNWSTAARRSKRPSSVAPAPSLPLQAAGDSHRSNNINAPSRRSFDLFGRGSAPFNVRGVAQQPCDRSSSFGLLGGAAAAAASAGATPSTSHPLPKVPAPSGPPQLPQSTGRVPRDARSGAGTGAGAGAAGCSRVFSSAGPMCCSVGLAAPRSGDGGDGGGGGGDIHASWASQQSRASGGGGGLLFGPTSVSSPCNVMRPPSATANHHQQQQSAAAAAAAATGGSGGGVPPPPPQATAIALPTSLAVDFRRPSRIEAPSWRARGADAHGGGGGAGGELTPPPLASSPDFQTGGGGAGGGGGIGFAVDESISLSLRHQLPGDVKRTPSRILLTGPAAAAGGLLLSTTPEYDPNRSSDEEDQDQRRYQQQQQLRTQPQAVAQAQGQEQEQEEEFDLTPRTQPRPPPLRKSYTAAGPTPTASEFGSGVVGAVTPVARASTFAAAATSTTFTNSPSASTGSVLTFASRAGTGLGGPPHGSTTSEHSSAGGGGAAGGGGGSGASGMLQQALWQHQRSNKRQQQQQQFQQQFHQQQFQQQQQQQPWQHTVSATAAPALELASSTPPLHQLPTATAPQQDTGGLYPPPHPQPSPPPPQQPQSQSQPPISPFTASAAPGPQGHGLPPGPILMATVPQQPAGGFSGQAVGQGAALVAGSDPKRSSGGGGWPSEVRAAAHHGYGAADEVSLARTAPSLPVGPAAAKVQPAPAEAEAHTAADGDVGPGDRRMGQPQQQQQQQDLPQQQHAGCVVGCGGRGGGGGGVALGPGGSGLEAPRRQAASLRRRSSTAAGVREGDAEGEEAGGDGGGVEGGAAAQEDRAVAKGGGGGEDEGVREDDGAAILGGVALAGFEAGAKAAAVGAPGGARVGAPRHNAQQGWPAAAATAGSGSPFLARCGGRSGARGRSQPQIDVHATAAAAAAADAAFCGSFDYHWRRPTCDGAPGCIAAAAGGDVGRFPRGSRAASVHGHGGAAAAAALERAGSSRADPRVDVGLRSGLMCRASTGDRAASSIWYAQAQLQRCGEGAMAPPLGPAGDPYDTYEHSGISDERDDSRASVRPPAGWRSGIHPPTLPIGGGGGGAMLGGGGAAPITAIFARLGSMADSVSAHGLLQSPAAAAAEGSIGGGGGRGGGGGFGYGARGGGGGGGGFGYGFGAALPSGSVCTLSLARPLSTGYNLDEPDLWRDETYADPTGGRVDGDRS